MIFPKNTLEGTVRRSMVCLNKCSHFRFLLVKWARREKCSSAPPGGAVSDSFIKHGLNQGFCDPVFPSEFSQSFWNNWIEPILQMKGICQLNKNPILLFISTSDSKYTHFYSKHLGPQAQVHEAPEFPAFITKDSFFLSVLINVITRWFYGWQVEAKLIEKPFNFNFFNILLLSDMSFMPTLSSLGYKTGRS